MPRHSIVNVNEVLDRMIQGECLKSVALSLGISRPAVSHQLIKAQKDLGLKSIYQLVAIRARETAKC